MKTRKTRRRESRRSLRQRSRRTRPGRSSSTTSTSWSPWFSSFSWQSSASFWKQSSSPTIGLSPLSPSSRRSFSFIRMCIFPSINPHVRRLVGLFVIISEKGREVTIVYHFKYYAGVNKCMTNLAGNWWLLLKTCNSLMVSSWNIQTRWDSCELIIFKAAIIFCIKSLPWNLMLKLISFI